MKRFFVCTFVCLLLTSAAQAQDNPLGKLWPFGKGKEATPKFSGINPFDSPVTSSPALKPARSNGSKFAMPSPTKLIDKAEQSTSAAFNKTRGTWKGVQDFGKSLNPFAAKPTPKKKRRSFVDMIFPKEPAEERTASTVNDFLKLKRPRF